MRIFPVERHGSADRRSRTTLNAGRFVLILAVFINTPEAIAQPSVPTDQEIEAWRRECVLGSPESCEALGRHVDLRGVPDGMTEKQLDEAFTESCSYEGPGKVGSGCRWLGSRLRVGDPARTGLLKKACDRGDAPACLRLVDESVGERRYAALALASLRFRGTYDGSLEDLGVVIGSCRGSWFFGNSCLGEVIAVSDGFEPNLDEANPYTEIRWAHPWTITQACLSDRSEGCTYLGAMHEFGIGVARDRSKAQRLYSRACALGDVNSCARLSALFCPGRGGPTGAPCAQSEVPLDAPSEAMCLAEAPLPPDLLGLAASGFSACIVQRAACDEGDWKACQSLASTLSAKSHGLELQAEIERVKQRASHLVVSACEAGDLAACLDNSDYRRTRDLETRALAILGQRCEARQVTTPCLVAASVAFRDKAVRTAWAKIAAGRFEAKCQEGDLAACREAASTAGRYGLGRPDAVYSRACKAGAQAACGVPDEFKHRPLGEISVVAFPTLGWDTLVGRSGGAGLVIGHDASVDIIAQAGAGLRLAVDANDDWFRGHAGLGGFARIVPGLTMNANLGLALAVPHGINERDPRWVGLEGEIGLVLRVTAGYYRALDSRKDSKFVWGLGLAF